MPLSDFPLEIKIKIMDYLSIEDKVNCSLVCKSWTRVFQDSMHSDLFINHRGDLRNAVYLRQDHKQNYKENGHLVQYLNIDKHIHATDDELCALQNNFKNVKYLHIDALSLTSVNLENNTGWHHWRSLRELYICMNHVPTVFKTTFTFHSVGWFGIRGDRRIFNEPNYTPCTTFSLSDFETIHSYLPYLTHLELTLKQLTLSDAELERMTKVSPATTMNSFIVHSAKTDHRFIYYFAYKYPNLCTLKFDSFYSPSENEDHAINTTPFLQTSSPPFQHLKKLDITYTNCHGTECLIFWDMIKPYNIPLKHVSITIEISDSISHLDKPYDFPKYITETCLKAASSTIESFSVKVNKEHTIPFSVIDIKDILCNLVELNFDNLVSSLELDTLLEVAPRLKDLSLQYTDVKIKGEIYDSKRFGLQSFIITESTMSSDVLRFLSFHCRKLDLMSLDVIAVSGSLSVPGCQFIDMTYTRLESLYLSDIQFIISDSKKCPENLNIALITRPVKDMLPKQEYDPNVLPTVIGATPTKCRYQWLYTSASGDTNGMTKAHSLHAKRFFSEYEENKKKTIEKAARSKKVKQYMKWNNSCVFGYTKIELGYVADYDVDTIITSYY